MNIKEQFDFISKKYDGQRRQLIPCFDDLYNIPLTVMEFQGERPKILDIGGGTGLFTSIVMGKYPEGEYTLIDLSEKMLDVAKERFKGCKNVKYIVDDYTIHCYKDKYDIIISYLSIHHLEEDKKKNLYNTIYSLLNDGGIFINADQMLSPDKEIEELFIRLWKEDILNSGLELEEAEKAFERMKLDKPSKLSDQLQWLKNAGFIKSDCLYKYRNFCTIYGKK